MNTEKIFKNVCAIGLRFVLARVGEMRPTVLQTYDC